MATQALILAAGRGSRLGPRTKDVPKPLLQIGPKRLIEHQLEMLADAGVGPVGMVVGYQSDEIVDVVGSQAEYIYNHKWSTTNSLSSFLAASQWVDHDLILMNCDLLLHPQILDKLLAFGVDAFAYDSSSGKGREHMKVRLKDSSLAEMSKDLQAEHIAGENVGILYFSKSTVERLFEIAADRIADGRTSDWVGSAVEQLSKEIPLRAIDISGLSWAEIDFEYDLVRARKEVWPAIRDRVPIRRKRIFVASALMVLVFILLGWPFNRQPSSQPVQEDWDTVTLTGGTRATIDKLGSEQSWWEIGSGESIRVDIVGPDTLRFESRLLIADTTASSLPYLLSIWMDGEPNDWEYYRPDVSKTATYQGQPVSKRMRTLRPIPTGKHTFTVSANGIGSFICLLRIRKLEDAYPADD